MGALSPVGPGIYLFRDTCNVYLLKDGKRGVLIDFGSGAVLDAIGEAGIDEIMAVLFTHHHRDQAQGLTNQAKARLEIWVPHMEQHFFQAVDAHWQGRELYNSYNNRQDRFSLLEPVTITGTLKDYAQYTFGQLTFTVFPTPGHTPGSITLLTEVSGKRYGFSGDLMYSPGKIWSLAATQWTYNGAEGVAATIASLLELKEENLDWLLPSHGQPISNLAPAIDRLIDPLWELLQNRQQNPRLFRLREQPFVEITPHLLHNRTSMADYYVLLSQSGKALFIDFGYDFMTGAAAGFDRGSRRPWLYTLSTLKRQYGVDQVEVVIPTHYHDDHVAGFNLLRDREGAKVWAPANFAAILEKPWRYDLPCLWYDPIPVDRVLPLSEEFTWEEYQLTVYPQPGHTQYAAAIYFAVDGQKVLAIGDQYQGEDFLWNYVYKNRYQIGDYAKVVKFYRSLQSDLLLTGHGGPKEVNDEFLANLEQREQELDRLHRALLPLADLDLGAEGFAARLEPYQVTLEGGKQVQYRAEVRNPLPHRVTGTVRICKPQDFKVDRETIRLELEPHEWREVSFVLTVPEGIKVRRARLAVDLTMGEVKLGQQAEALVTVRG